MLRPKRPKSARRLTFRASAKVNLTLEVLGRRPDGYHEVATVLQAVDLFDRVMVEDAPALELRSDDPDLPTDERNLIVRAARLLREAAGIDRGARIRLAKRIPVAAGLGGGSSDAAAALAALNRLWGLRWPRRRLEALGVQLGMDVPFFLGTSPAVGRGRGELLEPLDMRGGHALVLVNPRVPLAARAVYERVPAGWRAEPAATARMVRALRGRNEARVAEALTNHLEGPAEAMLPVIGRMKAALMAAGALGALMSGSGPTVFGLARSYEHARQIRRRVTRADWACWAVRTHGGPAVRAV
jgi:4-diphosphocytidyl-2-C-methyl-D-erythritol kinase